MLVSAWISGHGFPRRVLEAAEDGRFGMVVSGGVLEELADVLSRDRLRRYGTLELAEEHVRRVRAAAGARVEGEGVVPERVVPADPKDDYLVALARASRADCIVSGDPHLNALEGEGLPAVLTPRAFWERLLEAGRGGSRKEDQTT